MNSRWIGFAALALVSIGASGQGVTHVPVDLEDWRDWVLHGEEHRRCPFLYNSPATKRGDFICAWPGELDLSVTADGGRFEQTWTVYAKEQWIPLPGDEKVWPRAVAAGGVNVAVVLRDGDPAVLLSPGRHDIHGTFAWDERPATLAVPRASGLLDLTVDGERIVLPRRSDQGVWFGEGERAEKIRDELETNVYRRIEDEVPMRLTTVFEIHVAGTVREELIAPALPDGFVPLSLDSELPVQLSPDGDLRVQARPGSWHITLGARAPGVVEGVTLGEPVNNLPDREVWSYQANPRLRTTLPQGPRTVDPTLVGSRWPGLPTFLVEPGESLTVVEHNRGLANAHNSLHLTRKLWLDFDGSGYVFADAIAGEMLGRWRLDMTAPYALQNAAEHGEVLLVTRNDALAGVEVRNPDLDISVQGRVDVRGEIPVAGWDTDLDTVAATLNVPPGHKLLTALGVDHAPSSWTGRWQLLDFFLLLIVTGAVARLFGRAAGLVALVAMTLGFHEPGAPLWTWLNLLVAVALVRVAPEGRLLRVAKSYRIASFVVLLLFLVPFLVGQIRIAVFPQLEPLAHRQEHAQTWGLFELLAGKMPTAVTGTPPESDEMSSRGKRMRAVLSDQLEVSAPGREFSRFGDNALLQTGPGRPDWEWTTYSLSWDGPVDTDRTMRLVIVPDWLVAVLRFLAVAALGLFAAFFAYDILGRRWKWPSKIALRSSGASAAVVLFAIAFAGGEPAAAEPPPADILDELKQRLLTPPSCAPRCAEVVDADVAVAESEITIRLGIHAVEAVAVPMPGTADGWRPERIVAGQSTLAAYRDDQGALWVRLDAGRHELTLQGPLPPGDTLEIPFAATPRSIAVHSDHWFVAGIQNRILTADALNLTRLRQTADEDTVERWQQSRLPVFVRVERFIDLRLDWQTANVVSRVAPQAGAINVEVPLLEGEAVLEEVATGESGVLVSMNPSQQEFAWYSSLPRQPSMTLMAPMDRPWREVWRFDIGSAWKVEFEGIPESGQHETRGAGRRVAVFHPRPGETLNVSISRPEAAPGGTLAFDDVAVHTTVGAHQRRSAMNVRYRSTRGTSHRLQLPEASDLESVTIDGDSEHLVAADGELTVPIVPGEHTLTVAWNEPREPGFRLRTPQVELGTPSSNIVSTLEMPSNRWLLFASGPTLGPAVLYWPELIALVFASLILGRIGWTPLRTRDWLLLGFGFSTSFWLAMGVVVVWLLAHGSRRSWGANISEPIYRVTQIGFGVLTLAAFAAIVAGIGVGLLGNPDMSIAGYGSAGNELRWFADQTDNAIPRAAVYSVPLWAYKALILAWALWLSFALIRWLPWVWNRFAEEGLWYRRRPAAA